MSVCSSVLAALLLGCWVKIKPNSVKWCVITWYLQENSFPFALFASSWRSKVKVKTTPDSLRKMHNFEHDWVEEGFTKFFKRCLWHIFNILGLLVDSALKAILYILVLAAAAGQQLRSAVPWGAFSQVWTDVFSVQNDKKLIIFDLSSAQLYTVSNTHN